MLIHRPIYRRFNTSLSQVTANRIRGFLQTRVLQFLLSLQTTPRPVYLTRHGQSIYNTQCKVGGDSGLSPAGEIYAEKLAEFVEQSVLKDKKDR